MRRDFHFSAAFLAGIGTELRLGAGWRRAACGGVMERFQMLAVSQNHGEEGVAVTGGEGAGAVAQPLVYGHIVIDFL